MNILAVGAHPDDIELGCFASLALHYSNNHKIFGAIFSKGEIQGNANVRVEEAKRSANLIDMKVFVGDFPDGNLAFNSQSVNFLDEIIKRNDIDVIYAPSVHDRHQDHNVAGQTSISASRKVKELYFYETPSTLFPFNPQLFINVTKTFGKKIEALKEHKSQIKKQYMTIEALEGLAKYRGYQLGISNCLGEAFEIHKVFRI